MLFSKKPNKKVCLCFILCFLSMSILLTPIFALSTMSIPYWYSDENDFYRYGATPTIWHNTYDNLFIPSAFLSNINHARSQWRGAGLSTSTTASQTDANVQIYGGSYEMMKLIDNEIRETEHLGKVSRPSTSWEVIYKVGSSSKQGYRTYSSKMVVVH